MLLDQSFWDNLYQKGETGWDMGTVSPPLKNYIDQLENKRSSILIPGAGNSYEALYLLQHGFTNISVVDIAPTAIAGLKEKSKDNREKIQVYNQDFFHHTGKYDLILEQTFFCALEPKLRKDYAAHMVDLLNEKGKLAGVLFNKEFPAGHPPFGGNEKDYQTLFTPYFNVRTWAPCYNSHPARAGSEWFMILEKK